VDDSAFVPAIEAMIAMMYDAEDALEDLEQPTILQLALLANRYDAPKVLSTALQQLEAEPLAPAALALWWQLPGFQEDPAWQPVWLISQALSHKHNTRGSAGQDPSSSSDSEENMQQAIQLLVRWCGSDLEMVWAGNSDVLRAARRVLLGLDADVLAAFLKSPQLQVVSEDTVLFTVEEWHANQADSTPLQQYHLSNNQDVLMSAVRFPELSTTCLCFIAPELSWIPSRQCRTAVALKHHSFTADALQAYDVPDQWLLGQRSCSCATSHTITYSFSLQEIHTVCSEVQGSAAGTVQRMGYFDSTRRSYGGRIWEVFWQASQQEDDSVHLGVYLYPNFPGLKLGHFNFPWNPDGVTFSCGAAEPFTVSGTAQYTKRAFGDTILTAMPTAEELADALQALDDDVTVEVTIPSSCCL